jgi:glycosyltransferase involved in cell wall biosynthesis
LARVVALIPAFNEEDTIAKTIAAVSGIPEVDEVLVVDDGSTDATSNAAEAAGARVLRMTPNAGKGAALNKGLDATDGEIVLMVDADLGDTAAQTSALLAPVLSGQADMTIAAMKAPPGSQRRIRPGLEAVSVGYQKAGGRHNGHANVGPKGHYQGSARRRRWVRDSFWSRNRTHN